MKNKITFFALFFILVAGSLISFAPSLGRADNEPQSDFSTAVDNFSKMNNQQKSLVLSSMGVPSSTELADTGFSTAKVLAWILFGAIGMGVLVYGKKHGNLKPILVGLALIIYPYFFTSVLWLYGIGLGLCLLLLWRD